MISTAEWAQFKLALADFSSEVAQQVVTWQHLTKNLPRYNEGETPTYASRSLLCTVAYNSFRTWPIGTETETGVIDKEYCYLLLNNDYLIENGWLTTNKNLDFNPNDDIFWVNGVECESLGDTPISQDKSLPLYTIIVLKRKTDKTGVNPRS